MQFELRIARVPAAEPRRGGDATDEWRDRPKPQSFRNILVVPQSGDRHRGGPIWPQFHFRIRPRTCWGIIPFPIDTRPCAGAFPSRVIEAGYWCGLVGYHYGHMIADFGMRIVRSAAAHPALPLIFGLPAHSAFVPPDHFWQMIDALGVDRARVVLVREPTIVGTLLVFPQAERPYGGGPGTRHLDLMDRLLGDKRGVEKLLSYVFVSRSRVDRGGLIAGESYLEEMLERQGVVIFHPQEHTIAEQIAVYAQARTLIFSEGSAVHTLQLVGRLGADVAILVRRPWHWFGFRMLARRVDSLRYLRAVTMLVRGLGQTRRSERNRGISILDETRLLRVFRTIGIELAGHWDGAAFRSRRDADIRAWVDHRKSSMRPAGEGAHVNRQLAALGIGLRYWGDGPAPLHGATTKKGPPFGDPLVALTKRIS